MKVLGISFQKARIRFTLLETQPSLQYLSHEVVKYDPELTLGDLAERWSLDFLEYLNREKPDRISVVEVWESGNRDTAKFQIMPVAILAFICAKRALPLSSYTHQAFSRGKAFGLTADIKPLSAVDDTFGKHPPHWDDTQRRSVLAAWRAAVE